MKMIEAIIRPKKLDAVLKAIESTGYSGVTITEIKENEQQKGLVQQWRGSQYRVTLPIKVRIEIVAKTMDVEKIRSAVASASRTGEIGDGKIFVFDISDAYKIRTGETGDDVI